MTTDRRAGPSSPRSSRLGGAILIAGAAALAIVLAIVLIGGGDDAGSHASGVTSSTQAQTSPRTQTTAGTAGAGSARAIGAAALRATLAGGDALGAAIVQQLAGGKRQIVVEVAKIAPNGAQDAYAIWLQGSGGAKLLGFVPRPVGTARTFTVSAPLASTLRLAHYATVLVTRETTTAQPTAPGTVLVSGPLRLAG